MTTGNDSMQERLRHIDRMLGKKSADDEDDDPSTESDIEQDDLEENDTGLENGTGPEEDSDDKEGIPAYLLDEMPRSKVDAVKWKLLRGTSEEELVSEGYNMGTIRNCVYDLKKKGLYERPPKGERSTAVTKDKHTGLAKTTKETALKSYARGSPAEDLIQHFARLPDDIRDKKGEVFESGMKFGLSVAVLGIRMAQELSNLGVSQVKPMIEMTKSMREGEALAAKTAAVEAATEAASQIGDILGPTLQDLRSGMAEQRRPRSSESDPMREMMIDTMKPLLKGIMSQMIPGGMPGTDTDEVVSGWTKRKSG